MSIDKKRMEDWEYVAEVTTNGSIENLQKRMIAVLDETIRKDFNARLRNDILFLEDIIKFREESKSDAEKAIDGLDLIYAYIIDGRTTFDNPNLKRKFRISDVITNAVIVIKDLEAENEKLKQEASKK